MVLVKELVNLLNEDGEPLAKRLRIANYAFNSVDMYSVSKETYLLQWITNITESSIDALRLFDQWLSCEHFKRLSKIDISQDCIKRIYKVICDKLNSEDVNIRRLAISSSFSLINNSIFHDYFKLNLKSYFGFLSKLVACMAKNDILKLLNNENIFSKIYYTTDKFYKYFFASFLPALGEVNDEDVFHRSCYLVQKYILNKNFRQFDDYLQQFFDANYECQDSILAYFFKTVLQIYGASSEVCAGFVRIFFSSVCNEYPSGSLFVYKLSIVLFQVLGFNMSKIFLLKFGEDMTTEYYFDKSLAIAVPIFEALSTFKIELKLKINEVEFFEFIEMLVSTIMNLTGEPNKFSLKVIYYCTDIDPLIIDRMISEILKYLLMKNSCKEEYKQLFKTIFKVFGKLHRVHNLISKLLSMLKQQLSNDVSPVRIVDFIGIVESLDATCEYDIKNIFPEEILGCFHDCVTNLASWQVINLFKTFLFHLASPIDDNLQDKNNLIYIEVTGVLLCHFLSSVRIAEHTVPDAVVNKFVKAMEELKVILNKFGNVLITMEHDHILMRTFLNICYTWGDLYMILSYYSTNVDILLTEIRNQDHSLANISYIHPYLTAAQWSLISERVNNFGKATCKQLMQNLYIQHIKAVLLFENKLNEDMVNTLISNFTLSLKDLWQCIVQDSFILNNVVSRMHSSQIFALADVIITNILEQDSVVISLEILDSEMMLKYLIYSILLRINKLFKQKKSSNNNLMSTKIFKEFHKAQFSERYENHVLLNNLLAKLNEEEVGNGIVTELKINHTKLFQYLEVLKKFTIVYISDEFRSCTAVYLLAVLSDLRKLDKEDSLNTEYLETILTGILRATGKPFALPLKPKSAIHYLVKNITRYKKIFNSYIESLYAQDDFLQQIEDISNHILEFIKVNDKTYERCMVILLFNLIKHKRMKTCPQQKNSVTVTVQRLSKKLIELITTDQIESLPLYALALKIELTSVEQDIEGLKKYLGRYTEMALDRVTQDSHPDGALLLLTTVLCNISKFDIVKDDFLLKIWDTYKNVHVIEEYEEDKQKLLILIFGHISNENFKRVTEDLLQDTIYLVDNQETFMNYINVWCGILSCNFNPTKRKVWIKTLDSLLQRLLLALTENDNRVDRKGILEFEVYLAKAVHVHLTSSILDTMFLTISHSVPIQSLDIHNLCIKLSDVLLRYRKPLMTDRLPSFTQQYRVLLQAICLRSDTKNIEIQHLGNSAHQLEKLTKNLVSYGKHVARITPYIIADILAQFETTNLVPEVKMHLENCIYSLLRLCDQHSILYLMRTLSVASTEIFKYIYENYNKFYRYKGKV